MASNGTGTPPFNQARVIGGLALLGLVVAIELIAAVAHNPVDTVQLGFILGTAAILLGVEGGRWLIR